MNDLHLVEEKLLEHLARHVALPPGTDEKTDLIDGGILDSLTLVDLVLFIQSEFRVTLQPADVMPENFRTVAQLAKLVHQRISVRRQNAA